MDLLDRLRLDVPVAQAGMGGGLAGPELAGAVAAAGALGTLGLTAPDRLIDAAQRVREVAPGRAVAVNLLMPFVRRSHLEACVNSRVDVAVMAFGIDRSMIQRLRDGGVLVFVMVGTEPQARRAIAWGADGLIAQGREAGGHLTGDTDALGFLPVASRIADGRPVLLAGGIASAQDTRAALAAGADGVVAGTRFLLTRESRAHPVYQQRILAADKTFRTTLFGLAWPAPHRVVANAATRRWCDDDGRARLAPRLVNALSSPLARLPDRAAASVMSLQKPALPLFSPVAPTVDIPESSVDRTALYAGETVLRIDSVISAREAVAELWPGGH
ncbi:NAD(P)H-dependent flavin oxidoreductase [Mycolicibacterium holsaticum]|uniref:Oxidoreductase n=1 Tax=Mycolicibacterium holsaticum TaxID=152142 RepID=A0A1E3S071_9MYCO|nr:nitronate monooxygenase [Mycolicibacterium holsaticum]ODQ95508.1 oxidoreductase [Mycolicibacterium holsaticum]